MNWKEIKEKFPKAWNDLIQFKQEGCLVFVYLYNRYELGMDEDDCGNDFHVRELFDFFDENDIKCQIEYFPIDEINDRDISCWGAGVWDEDDFFWNEGNGYNSRKEAEEVAFTKAFELLEKKLI